MPHRIRQESNPQAPPVAIIDGEIRVRGDPAHLARRVRDHLVRLARQELSRRARLLAARIDKPIARVTVRDTKSRAAARPGASVLQLALVLAPGKRRRLCRGA
jgi:predicted metal-dependent hydrolase